MATAAETCLRFVPSRVEGLSGVTEVAVFPDRLEFLSEGQPVVIRFLDIARWHRRGWLYRPLARLGLGLVLEELVGAVHHVDAAGVGGIRVEQAAPLVAGEDADSLAVASARRAQLRRDGAPKSQWAKKSWP